MEIAERLADLSARILDRVSRDDPDEALRLSRERADLVRRLKAQWPLGAEVEDVVRLALNLGDQAVDVARLKAEELRQSVERVDQGRAGLSAYRPAGVAGASTLDTSR